MVRFLRSLRGKLILTYTFVTVMALLGLEIVVFLLAVMATSVTKSDQEAYLSDVITILYPQARGFLQPTAEDIPGLQTWLEQTWNGGKASLDPQGFLDSPAAIIQRDDPMYVLSPQRIVLAQVPQNENNLIGRLYTPPDNPTSQGALDSAYARSLAPLSLISTTPDGNYQMFVPVLQQGRDSTLVGVIVLTVKPPPPLLITLWPVLLGGVLLTGGLLLIGVIPFAALFGFIMSHGLTRRLKALEAAADAWSEGDFSLQPQDRSQDEIGQLGLRLRRMAERIQVLLHAQHELALLEERNRLARELHDTVKQQNFATLMQVRAARNLLGNNPENARQHLEEAEDLLKTSQQELGSILNQLHPAALEGQGLRAALRSYLRDWSQRSHIPVDFEVREEYRLPPGQEEALYRVAQEALANVARHSRAGQVSLCLAYAPGQVCLAVEDDGVGFDPQISRQNGFGLQSMQERVQAMGGTLEINSQPGLGTTLRARLPRETSLPGRAQDERQA